MPGSYASTKNAVGNCDRCGFEYPLRELHKEKNNRVIQNLRVCPECLDGDHPQNRLGQIDFSDNQTLRDPRPDSGALPSRDDSDIIWNFTDGLDGWETQDGSSVVSHDSTNGYLNYVWTATVDPGISKEDITTIDATEYIRVRIRVLVSGRASLRSFWVGECFFARVGEGFESGRKLSVTEPPLSMGDQWIELLWDFESHSDWNNTGGGVDSLRFDLYGADTTSGELDIDWIKIEKKIK